MKISIIGTGYVGLVASVCLAEKGHKIVCVDIDQDKVDKINRAVPPIYEKGLDDALRKSVNINLTATTDLHRSVLETDVSLIAVGTPFDGSKIDLTHVKEVSHQIGKALRSKSTYHLVVVKSTVLPGTTDGIVRPNLEYSSGKSAGSEFGVGMNPEFLREGEAIHDFMFPDRIVLGGMDEKSIRILEKIYEVFRGVDIIRTNNKTAEMIKYASNSVLATMISFSNEIANLCSTIGDIDVTDVMKGVHLDKRISPILPDGRRIVPIFTTYLEAGCGFGGSCFPKDLKALIAHGRVLGRPMHLLEAVIQVNDRQPEEILGLLRKHFPTLKGRRIAVLGLAFKPGTDDIRQSPAISIIKDLLYQEAYVKAYDPVANDEAQKIFDNHNITFSKDIDQAIMNVDAIALLTRWEEFKTIPERLVRLNQSPLVIDGRRILDKQTMERYECIGLSKFCN